MSMNACTFEQAGDRYLAICDWAKHRYSYRDERGRRCWNLTLPGGAPAPYTRIEREAWDRYMKREES